MKNDVTAYLAKEILSYFNANVGDCRGLHMDFDVEDDFVINKTRLLRLLSTRRTRVMGLRVNEPGDRTFAHRVRVEMERIKPKKEKTMAARKPAKKVNPVVKMIAEAEKEIAQEKLEYNKERYKAELRELDRAKKIVANVECELVDLKDEIRQDG